MFLFLISRNITRGQYFVFPIPKDFFYGDLNRLALLIYKHYSVSVIHAIKNLSEIEYVKITCV